MRDSVGGTFMIYVLLIFLAVYIVFVAVAFNYARAFRVKNKVIDIIEQNEGIQEMESSSNLQGITSGVFGQINIDGIESSYYKVRTFVYIEFPFMKLKFTIPVNGETRRIERINN